MKLAALMLRPPLQSRRAALCLEPLEERALLSVDWFAAMDGISSRTLSCGCTPPDPSVAAGFNHVVEATNSGIAIYDKATGSLIRRQSLRGNGGLFTPLGSLQSLSDTLVMADETTGIFVVSTLDFNQAQGLFRYDVAFSNDADPTHGFNLRRYNINDGTAGVFPDFPRGGYNGDAYVFAFRMFASGNNHATTLSIDKNNTARSFLKIVPRLPGQDAFGLTPAVMHYSSPSDPMWLVKFGGSNLPVVQMTNVLSSNPSFTTTFVSVPNASNPPTPTQPGGGTLPGTDGRIISVAYFGGVLVASRTVGFGGHAAARVDTIDTVSFSSPVMAQPPLIVDQGPGVHTFMPGVDINSEYDIGITFMESSSSEFLTLYITGQNVNDYGSGLLQAPVPTFVGTGRYTSSRIGDFSAVSMDPSDGYSFWGVNQYKGDAEWNTAIDGWGVSPNFDGSAPRRAQTRRTSAVAPTALLATSSSLEVRSSMALSSASTLTPLSPSASTADSVLVDGVFGIARNEDRDSLRISTSRARAAAEDWLGIFDEEASRSAL